MITFTCRRHARSYILVLFVVLLIIWFFTPKHYPVINENYIYSENSRVKLTNGAFMIDGRAVTILSGAVHYFRVVPEYWQDRLMRVKAAGLNTVETYVPWNLHEEIKGEENYEGILNIRGFIETAHRLGLYVILRPGPYICSEWDFGGLPSWLLHDPNMHVRSTYPPFLEAVNDYFSKLLPRIEDLQYQYDGPIIAVQVENEYGSGGSDVNYMRAVKAAMIRYGIVAPLFTSDNKNGLLKGYIPGVLMTMNFKNTQHGLDMMHILDKMQPGSPYMVTEYWSGWFDHWGESHHLVSTKEFSDGISFMLNHHCSINIYMFHGGTNFGFMNGANPPYSPTITSYDYDSPVAEDGDITEKYTVLRDIIGHHFRNTTFPPLPGNIPKAAYGKLQQIKRLAFKDIVRLIKPEHSHQVLPMEMLSINNNGGQGYGFTLYRHSDPVKGKRLTIPEVHDRAQIFADGRLLDVLQWNSGREEIIMPNDEIKQLDILVENCGRVNYGTLSVLNSQRKGLTKPVSLDGEDLTSWDIFPVELKPDFIQSMLRLQWGELNHEATPVEEPALYHIVLHINSQPRDTYLSLEGWTKGVVFVNSFNLGRYWKIGPQRTLYLPAPLLKIGDNDIIIFELHTPSTSVSFVDVPVLG